MVDMMDIMDRDEANKLSREAIIHNSENNNISLNELTNSILLDISIMIKHKINKGEFGGVIRRYLSNEESKIINYVAENIIHKLNDKGYITYINIDERYKNSRNMTRQEYDNIIKSFTGELNIDDYRSCLEYYTKPVPNGNILEVYISW